MHMHMRHAAARRHNGQEEDMRDAALVIGGCDESVVRKAVSDRASVDSRDEFLLHAEGFISTSHQH